MTRSLTPALILVAGCSNAPVQPVASNTLSTSAIELTASIRSDGSLAQMFVTPIQGEGGYAITLTGGDALLVSVGGGPDQPLARFESQYLGQLPTGAVDFEIIFLRKSMRIASAITLPPPFALAGPAAPASRSQPIPITWDAGTGSYATSLQITAPCLTRIIARKLEPDPGAFSIQPADLFVSPGTGPCDFKVELTRSFAGKMAPELDPSSGASASQIRTVTIPTVP